MDSGNNKQWKGEGKRENQMERKELIFKGAVAGGEHCSLHTGLPWADGGC